jgi:sirohydrochlorin ferrochelatase
MEQLPRTGVIIVDHGSRRQESNEMLLAAVEAFKAAGHHPIVEPAHMEIAQPDIATAYDRCVEQGATHVVVFPYFLSPGRHWSQDIPALAAAAAARHPQTQWLVTAPFGLHPLMQQVIADRIASCLHAATSPAGSGCDVCGDGQRCRLRSGGDEALGGSA